MNLHSHYDFWTTEQPYSMGHSLFLWSRQFCWDCCDLMHWSPMATANLKVGVPKRYASSSPLCGCLVNVDGIFWGHHLPGSKAVVSSFPCGILAPRLIVMQLILWTAFKLWFLNFASDILCSVLSFLLQALSFCLIVNGKSLESQHEAGIWFCDSHMDSDYTSLMCCVAEALAGSVFSGRLVLVFVCYFIE